jgi:hypothetical protein
MTSDFDKQLSQSKAFRRLQAQANASDIILGRLVLLAAQQTPDPQSFLEDGLNACTADVELLFATNPDHPDMTTEMKAGILSRIRELFAALTTASIPTGEIN